MPDITCTAKQGLATDIATQRSYSVAGCCRSQSRRPCHEVFRILQACCIRRHCPHRQDYRGRPDFRAPSASTPSVAVKGQPDRWHIGIRPFDAMSAMRIDLNEIARPQIAIGRLVFETKACMTA